jgi:hypothetical protein
MQLTPTQSCSLPHMVGVAMTEPDGTVVTDASIYYPNQLGQGDTTFFQPVAAPLNPPITIPGGDTFGLIGQWADVCSSAARSPFKIRVTFSDGSSNLATPPRLLTGQPAGGLQNDGPPGCPDEPHRSGLPAGGLSLSNPKLTRVVTGAGTTFGAPDVRSVRPYNAQTACKTFLDAGWTGDCGVISSPTASAVWVAESLDPTGMWSFTVRFARERPWWTVSVWRHGAAT